METHLFSSKVGNNKSTFYVHPSYHIYATLGTTPKISATLNTSVGLFSLSNSPPKKNDDTETLRSHIYTNTGWVSVIVHFICKWFHNKIPTTFCSENMRWTLSLCAGDDGQRSQFSLHSVWFMMHLRGRRHLISYEREWKKIRANMFTFI